MTSTEKIKVIILSHLFPTNLNRSKNIFIKEEVQFLSKRCNVKVIAPVPYFPPLPLFKNWYKNRLIDRYETIGEIEIFHPRYLTFPRALLFPLVGYNYYLAVKDIVLRQSSFDILHAHSSFPDGYASYLLARKTNKKLIITVHGPDIFTYLNSLALRQLISQAFIKCDKIIAVSTLLKKHIIKALGVEGNKIAVIPNGVDTTCFRPIMEREDIEKKLGLPANVKRIIYVGWLIKSKGVEDLLQAFESIAGNRNDLELCLVGGYTGSAWEKEYNEIVEKVKSSQFSGRIRLVGTISNAELPFWLNASDFLILPSRLEGFGVALIEALACGLPVISTRCGGPEDIVNENNGILVNPADVKELTSAILKMLSDLNSYDRTKIRDSAVKEYDYVHISEMICNVYKELRG